MMTPGEIEAVLRRMVADLGLRQPRMHVEKMRGWIHILVTTPSFAGKAASERDNLIWREFERRFDDETILAITQCYLLTPEEEAGAGLGFRARGAVDEPVAVAEDKAPYAAQRRPRGGSKGRRC
jgi:hypothetical protein